MRQIARPLAQPQEHGRAIAVCWSYPAGAGQAGRVLWRRFRQARADLFHAQVVRQPAKKL